MKEQNDNLKETLSALMDNEASELELRRVLRAMEQSEKDNQEQSSSLKASWHRYHTVRSLLDEQSRQTPSAGFLAGIRSEIEQSTPDFPSGLPKTESSNSSRSVFKVAGQGLIAASVAALALTFSFNLLQHEDASPAPDLAAGNGNVPDTQNLTAQNSETVNFTNELDPEAAEQLRRAVFRDLGGADSDESLEIPVRFSIDSIESYQD